MKRRDLIKKSALVTGAVATPVALDAGNSDALTNPLIDEQTLYDLYGTLEHEGLIEFTNHQGANEVITIDEETSKIVMRNLGNAHIVDYYKNYKFLLESKCNVVDTVPPELFNKVMVYMFDYDDMQNDEKYEDEEYGCEMISRIHHAWDIASDRHQDLMFQYTSLYELVAYEKQEIPLIPEEETIGKTFIPSPNEHEGDIWWDLKDNLIFMKEVDRMRDFLKKEGLWTEYRTIFKRRDKHNMDGFLEAWGLVSYIEFTNNNGL